MKRSSPEALYRLSAIIPSIAFGAQMGMPNEDLIPLTVRLDVLKELGEEMNFWINGRESLNHPKGIPCSGL
jgi:hypothetical protein